MNPTWQTDDGSIRLYHADCLDVLPQLEGVDAVVTDIPYGEVNRDSGGLRNLDKGDADVVTFTLDDVVSNCSRVASTSYVFCGTEQVSSLRSGFVAAGLTTRLGVWEKSNPSPMNGNRLWLSSVECCVFARKPRAYFGEHCQSSVWRGPTARNQVHPTQKPLWLFERLVKASVPPAGMCLDFCMGSGTAAIACIKHGRQFIGIEQDAKHFQTAVNRIKAELARTPLFAEASA